MALPVIGALAVAVCVSLRTRRPFFRQQRVGRGGVPFTLWKLRTLPESAPVQADKYALTAVHMTRLARFLRHSHLDELPQLFHVVSGRMSLVGPRPEMPWLLARFEPGFVAARLLVRPGCTGLWQISPDAAKLIGEAPRYDLLYLQHRSVRLDLWVLWRTVLVSIDDGRAVAWEDTPSWARGNARPAAFVESARSAGASASQRPTPAAACPSAPAESTAARAGSPAHTRSASTRR